jgi:hypothetical protein
MPATVATMMDSERLLAGFALAATIAKDPGAELARPGLCTARRDSVSMTARELLDLPRAERRARIRAWMEVQPKRGMWPSMPVAPLRAYGLLAQRMLANARPDWLRGVPLPRPGYTPEPQLLELLQRIAANADPGPVSSSDGARNAELKTGPKRELKTEPA